MKLPRVLGLGALVLAPLLHGGNAQAFPGFFAFKGGKPVNHSTHVVLMKKGTTTIVTVMPDYEGDMKPFAVVLPVPADVKLEDARTMRRDFVDRVDQISAPRFHEFWEMDPCEEGKQIQEWERDLSVKGGGFLGVDMGAGTTDPATAAFKPGKEMLLNVDTDFKTGEQKFSLASAADAADIEGWLKSKGYKAPEGANQAVAPYAKAGMSFLVAEVDSKKVELVGGDRAIVSPIRFFTNQPFNVSSTLGLLNLGDKQELFIHVIHPDHRFEVKNYTNVFPPTNLEVDFKVKERMGEFYAGIHDAMIAKQPQAILNEYAWPTQGCGQPCPNEPLMLNELLTLGGDVFEQAVPKAERDPKPPEMTDDEKKAFKEIKDKKQQKEIERVRKETVRRKALIERHHYVLSRMHHRYDRASLPKDVEVGPADPVKGGVDLPEGAQGALPQGVKPAAENKLQVRYVSLHQSPTVPHCDKPERYRWGIAPRTYMGLRKIYTAQDMSTKNRTSYKPAEMVYTPVADLGLAGHMDLAGGVAEAKSFAAPAPSASAAPEGGSGSKGSGCSAHPSGARGASSWLVGLGVLLLGARRRRSAQGGVTARKPRAPK